MSNEENTPEQPQASAEQPVIEQPSAGESTPETTAQATPEEVTAANAQATGGDEVSGLADQLQFSTEESSTVGTVRGKIDRFGVAMGTGRRKTAVARVRIKDGTGDIQINGRPLNEYFHMERDQKAVVEPLEATGQHGSVDVWVRVNGGGPTGQAGAVILGIARALQVKDPSLHHKLSEGGFLTRDERMVERKKYGRKKARRSFQFSKR